MHNCRNCPLFDRFVRLDITFFDQLSDTGILMSPIAPARIQHKQ